jgi:rod shape-determining protein MreC
VDDTTRRRLLGVLLVVTVALLVADLAGAGATRGVRQAAGFALGPVQRALAGASADELSRLRQENERLRAVAADQEYRLAALQRVRDVLVADATGGHEFVAARVVGTALGPLGGRSLTIDVGSADGVEPDTTVVAAEGLVGRVVSVSRWTSDVQVLGATGSVVGVRVGPAGTLGTVSAPGPSDREARPRGSLTLTFIQPATPVVGDEVRTLGSVGERPYAPGVVVGIVTAVDEPRDGATRTTRTATVRPAIDPDALDVVAVLLPSGRTTPRPVQGATVTQGSEP